MAYLKIPYGIANFATIREENYLYIDKTRYIKILEDEAPYQFFIRPRRFGKSLFISMLENYYDINKKDRLAEMFGGLYIGEHPTPKAAGFLVLRLSFAGINTIEDKEALIRSFDYNVVVRVQTFVELYSHFLQVSKLPAEINKAEEAIKFIIEKALKNNQKIFLLIDEYDNFANDLIGQGNTELYHDLLSSEGYVRTFYKTIKDGIQSSVARVFMTGVSPIMLDDLTSGFNITTNLTMDERLNEIMGFTNEELLGILKQIDLPPGYDFAKLRADLQFYYNGYLFNKNAAARLYNTDMALYFIAHFQRTKKYPEEILDNNVKTDYRKLRELAFYFHDGSKLEEIITAEELRSVIVDRFALKDMSNNIDNFISLLYYLGMLTIKEKFEDRVILTIPNYVIKKVYWQYFLSRINETVRTDSEKFKDALIRMRRQGEIDGFLDYVREVLAGLSNRDLIKFNEKYLKVILMTLLQLDGLYITVSEAKVPGGYVDLLLLQDSRYAEYVQYEWFLELKYVKAEDRHRLEEVRKEGIEQLRRYWQSTPAAVQQRFSKTVKTVVLTLVGKSEIVVDEVIS